MTWRVSSADYRGWRGALGQSHPLLATVDFEQKEAAVAHAAQLRTSGLTACVTEVPVVSAPRVRRRQRDGEAFNAAWKLHP